MEAARAAEAVIKAPGDPRFNIATATPSQTIKPSAIYTEEDAALDRELDRLANETAPSAPIERDAPTMVKTRDNSSLLSEIMLDLKPASTVNELLDQVYQAKEHGCDSIYATEAMIRHYNRKGVPLDVGYFIFHDIKVYIEGHFEQANKRDKMTIQEKVHGITK